MGNCTLPCDKKINDNNEVQVNENPEKSETVGGGGSGIKRKKTKFPKNIVIEDIEEEDDKPNK